MLAGLLGDVAADYDYILIDCNPSLGLLVINALTAADSVLIPIQTEYLAARGALMILSTIETIRRKRLNPHLKIEGILLTMADARASLTRDVQAAVEQQYGDDIRIFDTVVRRSVRFAESAAAGGAGTASQKKNASSHRAPRPPRNARQQTSRTESDTRASRNGASPGEAAARRRR